MYQFTLCTTTNDETITRYGATHFSEGIERIAKHAAIDYIIKMCGGEITIDDPDVYYRYCKNADLALLRFSVQRVVRDATTNEFRIANQFYCDFLVKRTYEHSIKQD